MSDPKKLTNSPQSKRKKTLNDDWSVPKHIWFCIVPVWTVACTASFQLWTNVGKQTRTEQNVVATATPMTR